MNTYGGGEGGVVPMVMLPRPPDSITAFHPGSARWTSKPLSGIDIYAFSSSSSGGVRRWAGLVADTGGAGANESEVCSGQKGGRDESVPLQCLRRHAGQRLDGTKWVGWSDGRDRLHHVDVTVRSPLATGAQLNTSMVSVCDRAE